MEKKNKIILIVAFIAVAVIIFIISNTQRQAPPKVPQAVLQTSPESKPEAQLQPQEEQQELPIPAGEPLLN